MRYFARTRSGVGRITPDNVHNLIRIDRRTENGRAATYIERIDFATLDWVFDAGMLRHIIEEADTEEITAEQADAVLEVWRERRRTGTG